MSIYHSHLKGNHDAIHSIDLLIKYGNSRKKACNSIRIRCLYYCHWKWKKVIQKVDNIKKEDGFGAFYTKGSVQKIHQGCVGLLVTTQEHFLRFVFKMMEQGIQCTNKMVTREAAWIVSAFQVKSSTAQEQISSWCHIYHPETFQGNQRWLIGLHYHDEGQDHWDK